MSNSDAVQHAVELARSGDKDAARQALKEILTDDRSNASAWAAMAGVAATREEAVSCLKEVQRLKPGDPWAAKHLLRLGVDANTSSEYIAIPIPGLRLIVQHMWIVVLAWIAVIYLLTNLVLLQRASQLVFYVTQPVLWLILAFLSFVGWRHGLSERPPLNKWLVATAVIIGFFQVAVFVLAGLLTNFGRSVTFVPRFLPLLAILGFAGSRLVGLEMSRAYLVTRFRQRSPALAVLSSMLFFSLITIPPLRFQKLATLDAAFPFLGGTVVPGFSENALATYLALIGGPLASIAYRGVLQAFQWFSPILPDLTWFVTALLGSIIPIVGYIMVFNHFEPHKEYEADQTHSQPRASNKSFTFYTVLLVAALGLLWFNSGFFGVRPVIVIGNSMYPALRQGDVAVVKQISPEEVQVGDIIRYQDLNVGVFAIHRVVEIQQDGEAPIFITRGDNLSRNDDPVPGNNLEGKVVFVLPKVGWVSLAMREVLAWVI